MIAVFSYRSSRSEYYCGRVQSIHDSDLNIFAANSEEEAADWIAKQIKSDTDAEYTHLVFDKWEQVRCLADCGYLYSPAKGVESIQPLRFLDSQFDLWDDYEKQEKEANELIGFIRHLVKERL